MANIQLFKTRKTPSVAMADAINEAGGRAYQLSPQEALAQYAVTGCFNQTYYADAAEQLDRVIELAQQCEPAFIAQLAVYSRKRGYMKDMPALLVALLSTMDTVQMQRVFHQVIDNGRMLRNFVQMMRSGVVGRRSLGTAAKRLVQTWIQQRDAHYLLNASVGNAPSLVDILKMMHPKPLNAAQDALFGYLLDKPYRQADLPMAVQQYLRFKQDMQGEVPDVSFQLLTALPLTQTHWQAIAAQAPWQMTRMNLNTFARHGVFENKWLTQQIAQRLANAHWVRKARAFPYQLFMTYQQVSDQVPTVVREALHDAMAVALHNVPVLQGRIVVCVDVSGSMQSPVTGYRAGATTKMRCVDAAALFASALLAVNPQVEVIAFDTRCHVPRLTARDSVMTNAAKLAAYGGGGTDCSLPLARLNKRKQAAELVIYFSDNESWADRRYYGGTGLMTEWAQFKQRNPKAKLVLLDVQPYASTQAKTDRDVLNIGGFSDQVFDVIAQFMQSNQHYRWVDMIQQADV